jgi:hypothetical protein
VALQQPQRFKGETCFVDGNVSRLLNETRMPVRSRGVLRASEDAVSPVAPEPPSVTRAVLARKTCLPTDASPVTAH